MLCSPCQGVIRSGKQNSESKRRSRGTLHPNRESFFSAVDQGCLICACFWKRLQMEPQVPDLLLGSVAEPFIEYEGDSSQPAFKIWMLRLWLPWLDEITEPTSRVLNTVLLLNIGLPKPGHQGEETPALDPVDIKYRWPQVTSWIDECINHHPLCQPHGGRQRKWTPTRLIDLGPLNDTTIRPPRLCLQDECLPELPYVTLSHCWGSIQPLRLLTSNFDQFRIGIPGPLPPTFADALAVAKLLNVRYVWIDSLCIIQDSVSDWLHESGVMGLIYNNSFLNIAAASASSSKDGCYLTRYPRECAFWTVFIPENKDAPSFYCSIAEANIMWSEFENSALNRRAWVMQERLLAPRILHFSRWRMFWECRSTFLWENMANDTIKKIILDPNTEIRSGIYSSHGLKRMIEPNKIQEVEKVYSSWRDMIQFYTFCSLTREEDKLIALSGFATKLAKKLDDTYLAGLWKGDLCWQLLWTSNDARSASRPQIYRAPSWSWAAINGLIEYKLASKDFNGGGEAQELISILETNVTTVVKDNPTGQVTKGYLRLRGKVSTKGWGGMEEFDLDSEREKIKLGGPNYLPVMVLHQAQENTSSDGRRVLGLLLEEVENANEPGVFKRIGTFIARRISDDAWDLFTSTPEQEVTIK